MDINKCFSFKEGEITDEIFSNIGDTYDCIWVDRTWSDAYLKAISDIGHNDQLYKSLVLHVGPHACLEWN